MIVRAFLLAFQSRMELAECAVTHAAECGRLHLENAALKAALRHRTREAELLLELVTDRKQAMAILRDAHTIDRFPEVEA